MMDRSFVPSVGKMNLLGANCKFLLILVAFVIHALMIHAASNVVYCALRAGCLLGRCCLIHVCYDCIQGAAAAV